LLGTNILANGGYGGLTSGGGSGGSISLLGTNVSLDGVQLNAIGGDGGDGTSWGGMGRGNVEGGGGGGGGIIDIVGQIGTFSVQSNVSGGMGYDDGQTGRIYINSVPEPSGIVLATIACLAGLSYGLIRRRAIPKG